MISRFILVTIALLTFVSCEVNPKPINYGSDGCHFCSMIIVDKQHAAQIVTKKGKAFKFDAVECMLNHMKDIDTVEIALYFCNYYEQPGELIAAQEATYLISENIPSPMGEFLTAFDNMEAATVAKEENGGELYSWNELLKHMNN